MESTIDLISNHIVELSFALASSSARVHDSQISQAFAVFYLSVL